MRKSDNRDDAKFRLIDHISVTKLNYRLYAVVLLVAIATIYLVVAQYFIYGTQRSDPVTVEIIRNDVQQFSDGLHPLVVVSVVTEKEHLVIASFYSSIYKIKYSSGDYVTNYTISAILPMDAFSTDFDLKIVAMDRTGKSVNRVVDFKTVNAPEVVFQVS